MTDKQLYSATVCVMCFIGIIVVLVLAVIFPVDVPFSHSTDGNSGMEAAYPKVTVIRDLQIFLNSLDDPRYDCGVVDGEAGSKFCVAINNWTGDQYYEESIKGVKEKK